MATKINKYGLSRDIPTDIKRAVRQKCGFGCVICGLFLYTYDHVDPLWSEAREHDSDKICLLCPNHHMRKSKGLITVEQIKEAQKNPKAKELGYSKDCEFLDCKRPIRVRLGNLVFDDPREIIRIAGQTLLALADLEDGKLALSGYFYDAHGKLILEIDRNEWRAMGGNWDVEYVSNRLTIRESASKLSLSVIVQSNHSLVFDNIEMQYRNVRLISKVGHTIEIRHDGKNLFAHTPSEPGGLGIETKGCLDIDQNGQIAPIKGPTIIGAGTIKGGEAQNSHDKVAARPYVRDEPRVGRNDRCPCGSGKKYKRCHGV